MAIYNYECEKCGHKLEVEQTPKTYKLLKKCPACKKHALVRDYSAMNVYYYNECRTIGIKAERNSNPTSLEFQDRKRQDKIDFGTHKFASHVKAGVIDRDQAKDLVEKHLDVETPWGEMDKQSQKKIFSGPKEEQAKKMETYIEKGTV